jgi:hypothetical protein
MRVVGALLTLGLAACASSGSSLERPSTTETVRVVGGATSGGIAMGVVPSPVSAREAIVAAPIDRVWAVLPAAFLTLGIPLSTTDPATHLAGNQGLNVRRHLGSTPLVRYLDCGNTQMGPSAETYDIRLAVTTQLLADSTTGGGTRLHTLVEAMGRPVAFSGEYSRCSSLGVLESRLADAVKAELQH